MAMSREQIEQLIIDGVQDTGDDPISRARASLIPRTPQEQTAQVPGIEGEFSFGALGRSLNNPIQLLGAIGTGLLTEGIIEPLQGVLSLPGLGWEAADNFLERAKLGLYNTQEIASKRAMITDDEIASQKAFGDFVGFILPAVASVGMVHVALRGMTAIRGLQQFGRAAAGVRGIKQGTRVMDAVRRYPLSNGFATEALGGAFYGGVFVKPEDGEGRINNALHEAAFFGLGRTVVNVPSWLGMHRLNYLRKRSRTVNDTVRGAQGAPTTTELRTAAVKDDVFQAYSEIEVIEASDGAVRNLIDTGDNLQSLLIGLRDTQLNKGRNRIAVELVNGDNLLNMPGVADEMARLRGSLPDHSLQLVKSGHTGIPEVHAAPRGQGLTGAQVQSIKNIGFYKGQYVSADGVEGVFRRKVRGKLPGTDDVIDLIELGVSATSKEKFRVPANTVRTLFTSADLTPFNKATESLYQTFRQAFEKVIDDTFAASRELTEMEATDLARQGKLDVGGLSRGEGQLPGSIYYNEEVAMAANGLPRMMGEADQAIAAEMQELVGQMDQVAKGVLEVPEEVAAAMPQKMEQLRAQRGLIRIFSPEGIVDDIAENGFAFSRFQPTFQDIPAGAIFDSWASPLAFSEAEHFALKGGFINRMVDDILKMADPDDVATLNKVREAYFEQVLSRTDVPIEQLAGMKGMQVFQNPQGTKFVIRDRMSGGEFVRESIEEARHLLRTIQRESPDLVANDVPISNVGVGPSMSDRPVPSYIQSTLDDYEWGAITENRNQTMFSTVNGIFEEVEAVGQFPLHTIATTIARKSAIGQQAAQVVRDSARKILQPLLSIRARRRTKVKLDSVGTVWGELEQAVPRAQLATMTTDELSATVRKLGHSEGMVDIIREMDRVMEIMNPKMLGSSGSTMREYMASHYGVTRPLIEAMGTVPKDPAVYNRPGNPLVEWMTNHQSVNRLARTETNPMIVLDKMIEQLYITDDIMGDLDVMAGIRNIKMGEIHATQASQIRAVGRRTPAALGDEAFAMNEPLRRVIEGFVNHYGFAGKTEYKTTIDFVNKVFGFAGIEVSRGTIEAFIQTTAQLMYGATLGFRVGPIVLNSMQVGSIGAPIWGGRHMARGIEEGLKQSGFERSSRAGGIIPERALNFASEISDDVLEGYQRGLTRTAEGGLRGAAGIAAEKLFQGVAAATGQLKKGAELGLRTFGHIDEVNRSIAFNAQLSIVQETMERLGGAMRILGDVKLQDKFAEVAMVGHSPTVRRQFFQQLKHFGTEAAEDYIGVEGAKLINFSYGQGLGPLATQTGWGRLFGMFGSHPVWMINYYRHIWQNSTAVQKAGIATRSAAWMGAMGVVGSEYNFNPMKFMPISFPTWTGGPWVNIVTEGLGVVNAPYSTKGATVGAFLRNNVPMVMPGAIGYKEMKRALDESGGMGIDGQINIPYMALALTFARPDYRPFADYGFGSDFLKTDPDVLFTEEQKRTFGNPAMQLSQEDIQDLLQFQGAGNTGLSAVRESKTKFNRR